MLAALALAWAVLVGVVAPWGDFPVNDDWVYAQVTRNILHGRFAFATASSANVFLQAYWGALFAAAFGFSYQVLRASTLVAALIGLGALYALVREAGGDRRVAAVAVLTLALDPIYVVTAGSFMTDVPFVTLVTLALWLFVRGERREAPGAVLAGLGVLLAAVLIRQHALLFLVACGLAHAVRHRFAPRAVALAVLAVLAGVAIQVAFQRWLVATGRTPHLLAGGMAEVLPRADARALASMIVKGALLLPYVGLIVAPLLLLTRFAAVRRLGSASPRIVALALAGLTLAQLGLVAAFHLRMPYYGNVLNGYGVGPLSLRDGFILMTNLPAESRLWHALWLLGLLLGAAAAAALLIELGATVAGAAGALRRRRLDDLAAAWLPVLGAASVILYLLLTAVMAIKLNAFDRYLLPLVPPLAMLIAAAGAGRTTRLPGAALVLALFAAYSALGVHDYFAFQRARLAATEALERAGVGHGRIDGGYEYADRLPEAAGGARAGLSYWAVGNDYVVALGPMRGYAAMAERGYPRWLTLDRGRVLTLRRISDDLDPETAVGFRPSGVSPAAACRLWLGGRPTCPPPPAPRG